MSQKTLDLGERNSDEEGSVQCLGMTFESNRARREYFLERLREKLQDPAFRTKSGFPKAEDEDILRLSDPPYYTACPNPFLEMFVEFHSYQRKSKNSYECQPFAADVTEGKTDPIYVAHSYHTKVPHKAIMRYILHYTRPGDIVLDGFCGSGMTGVAAQACAAPDPDFQDSVEAQMPGVEWGARRSILVDLSPAAAFVARGYNFPPRDLHKFSAVLEQTIERLSQSQSHLYEPSPKAEGSEFHYAIWTDLFTCPDCSKQFSFWDAAVDLRAWAVASEFSCSSCGAVLRKSKLERVIETYYDSALKRTLRRGKYQLSAVNKTVRGVRSLVPPTLEEEQLVERIDSMSVPNWHPSQPMLFREEGAWGQMWRAGYHSGVTHVHHFFTKRNMLCLADYWVYISKLPHDLRLPAQYVFTGALQISSRMSQFRFDSRKKGNTAGGIMKGALFVPSLSKEGVVSDMIGRRFQAILSQYGSQANWSMNADNVIISTGSCGQIDCPAGSVDYIFVDPPFGANIMYSEVSFLWEAWLRVFTSQTDEAIISDFQGKYPSDYLELMIACFRECFRLLKPGRWMTVEFHNSRNSVWAAIQEAIQRSGFVVADVRTLDKKQRSFKQLTTRSAVKRDLVISAYKPDSTLEHNFALTAGTEESVWSFVRMQLRQLPILETSARHAEVVAERQDYLLYDRMLAFHIQRGATVPLSAAEFYEGLKLRFPSRDGMFFLENQVVEYDRRRSRLKGIEQLTIFPVDEASAIQWVRRELAAKPRSFQDLQPEFMRDLKAWAKHEISVELEEILHQNFLRFEGNGPVPSQIHSYLSTNFKDLRNLAKDDPQLKTKATDRWYVPSPENQGDLEKLRENSLLRIFEEYRTSTKKKIKRDLRTEAIRAGFKAAYDRNDYQAIIDVAQKIPQNVLQEDEKLLMYYDVALTRLGED